MLAMEKDREVMRSGKGCRYVIEIFQNGVQEFLEIVKEPIKDQQGNIVGIVGLINDVSESEKLKRKLNRMAMVYRVGGDEFTIVLVNTDENEAKGIMRMFKEQYDQYRIQNQPLSISYGISTAESVRDDLRRVLEKADLDMC